MFKPFLTLLRTKIYLLAAFAIPALVLGGVYASLGVFPFGHRTILAMDMFGQYMSFYEALRRAVYSGGSLFYSWSKGLGGNMLGLETYYLSSPFSLIALLFPEKYLIEAMIAMTLAKTGCAGLAMALYLRLSKGAARTPALVFSIPYALLSYLSGYSYNIMWLDGMVFLPFIALGIERIAAGRRWGLYLAALTVMLIANYYIGYMLAIFSVLYFLYALLVSDPPVGSRTLLSRFGVFFGASLGAGGLSAFLLAPTYFSLSTGKLDYNPAFFSLKANFYPLDLLSKLLVGSYDSAFALEPAPPLYCGIAILLLTALFFAHRGISIRRKLFSGLLLLILLGSMYVQGIDLVWHGFQLANGFPYRYAFLFGFLCISLAFQAWSAGLQVSWRYLALAFGIGAACVLYVGLSGADNISRPALLISLAFIVGNLLLFSQWKRGGKAAIFILGGLVLLEAAVNTSLVIQAVDREFHYPDRVAYSRFHYQVRDVVDRIQSSDESFYRVEKLFNHSYNDGLELSYRGVSHFSSLYDINLQLFLEDIGLQRSFYRILYVGAPPPVDSILGLKYLLSYDPLENGYQQVDRYEIPNGQILTYRNPDALPLGFLVDRSLAGAEWDRTNPIHFQDQIVQSMLGPEGQGCFAPLPINHMVLQNVHPEPGQNGVRYSKVDPSQAAFIEIHYSAENDQLLYGYVASPMDHDKVEVTWAGESLGFYGEFREFNNLLLLGRSQAGTDLTLRLEVMWDKFVLNTPRMVFRLDTGCFSRQAGLLARNPWEISQYSDTALRGTVTGLSAKPLLYTSIPYDEGWKVRLDGQEIQKVRLLNAFIGVEIPPGSHRLEFEYTPPGLGLGCAISVVSWLGLIFIFYKPRAG